MTKLLGDRYEILRYLGSGTLGMSYLCRHLELKGHQIVVKVMLPALTVDERAINQFRDKIASCYSISHPNVVRAYEYLRDGDFVAYSMEYVNGGNLSEIMNTSDLLSLGESCKILREVCSGLQAIHNAGVIHQNLKPENILVTDEGIAKVTDFGIEYSVPGTKLTESGAVFGTIDYISPEYLLGARIDFRSDIYALGIIAYQMLTGMVPFQGSSVLEKMNKRINDLPIPPSSSRADISEAIDAIILRAISRNPQDRYQSAAEMRTALENLDS